MAPSRAFRKPSARRARIEREIRTLGFDGVVATRRDSIDQHGERTDAWVKVEFNPHQNFVIGGNKPDGTRGTGTSQH